jgi:hypothetical protein
MTDSTDKSDLLTGAKAIADYLDWTERRVYHAARQKYLPIGHMGALLIARKSQLDQATSVQAVDKGAA